MNRRGRAPRSAPTQRAKKTARAPKAPSPPPPPPAEPLPTLRLGFVRGVAPSKWAERWNRAVREQPLELVPLGLDEVEHGREEVDVLLERIDPDADPSTADRHAVRLYEETVALVVPLDHELADRDEVDLDDLALVSLIDHPDHRVAWPSPTPWQDPTWMPEDALATLELVSTGLGGALLSLPLARHLAGKRTHAVIAVSRNGESLLPGTEIWASWAKQRDANDVQRLIGVLRGRTPRSSR